LLHIGGARTAIFNYVLAKQHGGSFILRIDDTDQERSSKAFEEDIIAHLKWLGINWDEGPDLAHQNLLYRQSEKLELYLKAANKLIEQGKAYKDDGGAVRLRYSRSAVIVKDIVCGDCSFSTDSLGPEPVILRSDSTPTYHLASVYDDIEMKITHIIRGQDHLTNSAKHVLLFEALGAKVPEFAHLPLILGEDKTKLSKRNSTSLVSVVDFRKNGYLPQALVNFLMLLGWSHPEAKEQFSLDEIVAVFSLERVGKTGAIFETSKLDFLNGYWIRKLSVDELSEHIWYHVCEHKPLFESHSTKFWYEVLASLKQELTNLTQIDWLVALVASSQISISEEVKKKIAEPEILEQFLEVIKIYKDTLSKVELIDGADSLNSEFFSKIVSTLKKTATAPTKVIFQALRIAITGDITGPELKILVPFIKLELLKARASQAFEELSKL
jgi:nondiscriminating glutamyl-tRNA synthetase